MYVKTKTVSRQLDVNPSTIQRWVKHFDLPCHKNNHGHLLFTEEDIDRLKEIKNQLKHGLSIEDVKLAKEDQAPVTHVKKTKGVTMNEYERRLDELVERTNHVESKLSQKADEVVNVQLYQHRSELDDILKTITNVEERIQSIETQLTGLKKEETVKHEKQPKRNWIVSLFSA
jgi:chromosome-anchoring protein RacA